MRSLVLTYHSNNVSGSDYANNDHVALAEDLKLVRDAGIEIVGLQDVVSCVLGDQVWPDRPTVAISFDDGSCFDWYDLPHPTFGVQPSFRRILAEAEQRVCATSFVIASPSARQELDRTCLIGQGWWGDDWWSEATRGDLIQIENHSWDHNHETLSSTVLGSRPKGNFYSVSDDLSAELEIVQARRYIDQCAQTRSTLFAYPYGDVPAFLSEDYFPRCGAAIGLRASFSTEPRPISPGADPWRLGRYVCGHHWTKPEALRALLRGELSARC